MYLLIATTSHLLTCTLLPFQFGIAVTWGHAVYCTYHFCTHPFLTPWSFPLFSSEQHVLLHLDVVDMFNAISRLHNTARLQQHFPSLLHAKPNTFFYLNQHNTWDYFPQFKGLTQGCLVSGMLASLGLLLQAYHHTLSMLTSSPHSLQLPYMDDVSIVLS